ncbi:MAG: hypothetical protein QXT53_03395 [Ignisphaera sp.]
MISRRSHNQRVYLIMFSLILTSLVLAYALSSGLYDYMDILAILSIYTSSIYFLSKALISLRMGNAMSIGFKPPSFLINLKSFSNYIYKLLLFSILTAEINLFVDITVRNFVYSTLISIAIALPTMQFLGKLKVGLYRNIFTAAIVITAAVLYITGFINDKSYDLDPWIKFFEAMLHGL